MIVRNKKTNQYIAGMRLLPGNKLSIIWTDNLRMAEQMSPNKPKWEEGFKSFQKAMNLELELVVG